MTVLAHESAHASGIQAENQAECRAIETEPRAAELLGIPKSTAERLQHIYRGTVYPYDLPLYRTPPCAAGESGIVVADTVGNAANLRPLADVGKRIASSLPGWKDEGGASGIGPLGPCGGIRSRSEELARLGEFFKGPHSAYVLYSAATVKTKQDFSLVLSRYGKLARCDLRWRRAQDRLLHSSATETLGKLPSAVMHLSPRVKGFRVVYRNRKKGDDDRIHVFDPARRTMFELYIAAPAGELPVSVEVAAVRALLHSS